MNRHQTKPNKKKIGQGKPEDNPIPVLLGQPWDVRPVCTGPTTGPGGMSAADRGQGSP